MSLHMRVKSIGVLETSLSKIEFYLELATRTDLHIRRTRNPSNFSIEIIKMASKEKCFTFMWEIENISYCLKGKGEVVYSPDFVVNAISETKWNLGLFPRGEDDGNYIGFYLYRNEECKGPIEVNIKFDAAIMAEDGTELKTYDKTKHVFSKNECYGFSNFEKREIVFVTKRSDFLPRDTLTVRCRIWKCDGEMTEDVRCFAHTRIEVQRRSFQWDVKEFSSLEPEKKCTYQIRSIENNLPLMSVDIYLREGLTPDKKVSFELSLQNEEINFSTLRVFVIDTCGDLIPCNQEEFWFDDPSTSKLFTFFFTKSKLLEMKSLYLTEDVLSLYWEWMFSEGEVSEGIDYVQYTLTSSKSKFSDAGNECDKSTSLSNTFCDNLKSLYDESFLCDVKLKTKTCTFNAHKVVLSASSSVFKAMFSRDMKEEESGIVNIEDLSDDTIGRMLAYLYTPRIEDLNWEKASHLYVAADKYDILGLKNTCSSYLKENLNTSNACEVLLLSDYHADGALKSAVQDYILKHIQDVVNSEEWNHLMEANSKLAAETVCLQFKRN